MPRERIEQGIWFVFTPFFIFIRKLLLALRLIRHHERQRYLLGRLAPGRTSEEFHRHLYGLGFRIAFIAWVDRGEILNVRKRDGSRHQYHIRLFGDGEVRGHYEKTPERHPFHHFRDIGMEPRREEFTRMLEGWIA